MSRCEYGAVGEAEGFGWVNVDSLQFLPGSLLYPLLRVCAELLGEPSLLCAFLLNLLRSLHCLHGRDKEGLCFLYRKALEDERRHELCRGRSHLNFTPDRLCGYTPCWFTGFGGSDLPLSKISLLVPAVSLPRCFRGSLSWKIKSRREESNDFLRL